MALWLTNDEVQQVLDVNCCLEELERAYGALGRGDAVERKPSRSVSSKPLSGPDHRFQFRTIEGGTGNYWGIRVFPQVVKFTEIDGVRRRNVLPAAQGGLFCGFVLIFDAQTAELVAGMHDGYINWLAMGATCGLGLKHQARPEARVVGMIGAGWFGRSVFCATYAAHPFERAKVYAPTRIHAEEFAAEMSGKLGVAVEAVASAEAAVRGSDIVLCCTNTSRPVLDGHWLEPGSAVLSIVGEPAMPSAGGQRTEISARREVDEATLRRAGVIMVSSRAQAEWDKQAELYEDIKGKGWNDWDSIVDLADVVAGKARARTADDQITLFKQNAGLGIWYAAIGGRVFETARQRGIGSSVSRDLFLQAMRP